MADIVSDACEPMPWFRHDSYASDDEKIAQAMIDDEGNYDFCWYGRWWLLLEALAATPYHQLPFATKKDRIITARRLKMDVGECEKFLAKCAAYRLIDTEMWGTGKVCNARILDTAFQAVKRRATARANASGPRKKTAGKEADESKSKG